MIGQWASLITAAVAGMLTAGVLGKYARDRRPHGLCWALALALGALAALADFYAHSAGAWPVPLYRLFLAAALVLPGLMGAGTVYMLFSPRAGHLFLGLLLLAAVAMVGVLLRVDLTPPVPGGEFALPSAVKGFSRPFGYVGGLTMLLGGLYSWLGQRRGYAGLVALSAVLFVVSGAASSRGGPAVYYGLQALAMLVLYWAVAAAAAAGVALPRRAAG